jgi:hypothetical protein
MNELLSENLDMAKSFIRKLLYFDIFSYPLLPEEIYEYCDYQDIDLNRSFKVLEELKAENLINSHSGFYFFGDEGSKIEHRLEANQQAGHRMNDARKYVSIAASFPFVRAVFISGTLSKHVMKPESDIDFFIITEPGKLWVCRALLTLYKKLILRNSYRNFCLNYFVDSNNFEIPDKNIFTSTEVAFLLPMYNYSVYELFMAKNSWIRAEFPNFKLRQNEFDIQTRSTKKVLEYILNNRFGNLLDQLSFSIISGFWKRKFSHMSEKRFELNFRSQKDVSKHHPNAFQEKVVRQYLNKIDVFEQSTGFSLKHSVKTEL